MVFASDLALAQQNRWQPITNERLHDPRPGDWISYRRSYDVTAFSPLDQINRRNVDDLRVVWSYSMRDNSRWVATPIVANGLMYVAEGTGRVVAFDALTGELVWSHTRDFPSDIAASEVVCLKLDFLANDSVSFHVDAHAGQMLYHMDFD